MNFTVFLLKYYIPNLHCRAMLGFFFLSAFELFLISKQSGQCQGQPDHVCKMTNFCYLGLGDGES